MIAASPHFSTESLILKYYREPKEERLQEK